MKRISKKDYYLNIAKAIAERSPCLKYKYGAIIVKDDSIMSCGYNGPPRGRPHCKKCSRLDKKHGSTYEEDCPSVHAEMNAIINAARQGISTIDGIMYINGIDIPHSKTDSCYLCTRIIINSGIKKIILRDKKEKYI